MTKKKTIQIKVWSTATNPIPKVVITDTDSINLYNCIHTQLCTEQRHRQCVREGKCEGMKPRCEWDLFKMADTAPPRTKRLPAMLKNKCKKIVEDAQRRHEHCKPYTLTLHQREVPRMRRHGLGEDAAPEGRHTGPVLLRRRNANAIRNGWLKKPKKKAK
jgi:hypothetical protein